VSETTDFYLLSDDDQAARLMSLARSAARHWEGGFGDLELVKYRENAVFSARRPSGERIAVRIHRHGYHSNAALWSELHWMGEIAGSGTMEVPPVIRAADGRLIVEVTDAAVPEPRQVSILGWLSGAPVGTSESGADLDDAEATELYFDAGKLAATLHAHAETMDLPVGFSRHSWDADGLVGDEPLWGRFWDVATLSHAQRDLLQQARSAARADLRDFGKHPRNYGLIHADFVPENLLHDHGRLKLIDFDDAGFGWHVFELATALYFNVDEPSYPTISRALLEGYRAVRALDDAEVALLPLFLFLRGTTYLGWIRSRPETQTAKTMGPMLVERACACAERYLRGRIGAAR
jgi:Ser/Thr protein kinase RdoA (MazF antagonist)